ncbi:MAG: glucose-6-phosphate isomerase [Pseudomonadales bacterium]|nr:glucose-6-phosphate isomerase [Pseudomonadales bacterium]
MTTSSLGKLYPAWRKLEKHKEELLRFNLCAAFDCHPERADIFSVDAAGITLDYSKNLITEKTLTLLCELADQANLKTAINDLLTGKPVNNTEKRPALHTALRDPQHNCPDSEAVRTTFVRMEQMVNAIREGDWLGHTGQRISDIVNIGIGGSDLGPKMVCHALEPYRLDTLKCHFVSNVDPSHIDEVLRQVKPESTLFIVASKTFTTLETLKNAEAAKRWLLLHAPGNAVEKHFVAVSTAIDKVTDFGIDKENILPLWDWVGGRYSLWSAIGLPIAIATGMENFRLLLKGANAMDQHFSQANFSGNMPVILGLLGIWYSHFWQAQSHAVLPYDHQLTLFPDYLQQLDMESNGKSVNRNGEAIDYTTGPVIWGTEGTNGQHSFHQLLHQGTRFIPADFVVPLQTHMSNKDQHRHLVANCFSQSQALMAGKTRIQIETELAAQGLTKQQIDFLTPHKIITGNRPSNTLLLKTLCPESLGALIALYEHKVYVQSVVWNINAFDQWGVELGKQLSKPLYEALSGRPNTQIKADDSLDASTRKLVKAYLQNNHSDQNS